MANAGGKLAVVALRVPDLSATLHSWLMSPCKVDAGLGPCLNKSVTERLNHHYLPMAMDVFGGDLWVFYVRSAKTTTFPFVGWTGQPAISTTTEMARALNGAVAKGLLPVAFLTAGKDFLSLMLIPEGAKAATATPIKRSATPPPKYPGATQVKAAAPRPVTGPTELTQAEHERLAFSLAGKWARRESRGTAFWTSDAFPTAGVATWAAEPLKGRSLARVLADVQTLTERGRTLLESTPKKPTEGVVGGRPFALQHRVAEDAKGRTWHTLYVTIDVDGGSAQTVTAHSTDKAVYGRLVPVVAKALDTVSVR